jgi:uncharacterized protein
MSRRESPAEFHGRSNGRTDGSVEAMRYRTFGKTGKSVSVLGFGCMRLPTLDGTPDRIDEERATNMLRTAIDRGVNYVDTAYPYHEGASEPFVGRALSGGYREKTFLATKLPSWLIEGRDDFDRYLDEQLERLRTDRIDFYLAHALNAAYWEKLKANGLFDFMDAARADGRIGHAGFSFHDELPLFREIADARDWEFCLIQYNLLDVEFQAGTAGLEYAAEKGMGVAVMEPIRGGKLVDAVPPPAREVWAEAPIRRTPAEWALRFVWDRPEVGVVLSGMGEMAQLEENLRIAEAAEPGSLTAGEHALIDRVREIYRERMRVACTRCRYCVPCPRGVDIPKILHYLNEWAMFDDLDAAAMRYNVFVKEGERASRCEGCGECEEACPQGLPVRELLAEAEAHLEAEEA